jgi:hypothetical protein
VICKFLGKKPVTGWKQTVRNRCVHPSETPMMPVGVVATGRLKVKSKNSGWNVWLLEAGLRPAGPLSTAEVV